MDAAEKRWRRHNIENEKALAAASAFYTPNGNRTHN